MLVSTKGRYALRIMIDLAQHEGEGFAILMDVARRQEISEKYLESIVNSLAKAGLVKAQRGRGGGYCLAKPAAEYTVGEIIRQAEGHIAPVACLKTGESECEKASACLTLPLWQELDRRTNEYLDQVTLEDLVKGRL